MLLPFASIKGIARAFGYLDEDGFLDVVVQDGKDLVELVWNQKELNFIETKRQKSQIHGALILDKLYTTKFNENYTVSFSEIQSTIEPIFITHPKTGDLAAIGFDETPIMYSKKKEKLDLCKPLKKHSNSYLDLDGDCIPDLFWTCEDGFEIHDFQQTKKFKFDFIMGRVSFASIWDRLPSLVYVSCEKECKIIIQLNSKTQDQCKKQDITFEQFDTKIQFPYKKFDYYVHAVDANNDGFPDFLFHDEEQVFLFESKNKMEWTRTFYPKEKIKMVAWFEASDSSYLQLVVANETHTDFYPRERSSFFSLKMCVLDTKCDDVDCKNGANVSIGAGGGFQMMNNEYQQTFVRVFQLHQSFQLQLPCALVGLNKYNNYLNLINIGAAFQGSGQVLDIIPNSRLLMYKKNSIWIREMKLGNDVNVMNILLCLIVLFVFLGLITGVLEFHERREDEKQKIYWI